MIEFHPRPIGAPGSKCLFTGPAYFSLPGVKTGRGRLLWEGNHTTKLEIFTRGLARILGKAQTLAIAMLILKTSLKTFVEIGDLLAGWSTPS